MKTVLSTIFLVMLLTSATHAKEIKFKPGQIQNIMNFIDAEQTKFHISRECENDAKWQEYKGNKITNQIYSNKDDEPVYIITDHLDKEIGIKILIKNPPNQWTVISESYEDMPLNGFYLYEIIKKASSEAIADCHTTLDHPRPSDKQ